MREWWVLPHGPGSTSATDLPYNDMPVGTLFRWAYDGHIGFSGQALGSSSPASPLSAFPLAQPVLISAPLYLSSPLSQFPLSPFFPSVRPHQPVALARNLHFPLGVSASLAGKRACVVCSLARILQKLWQESSGSGKTAAHFFVALLPTQGAAYASRYV